MIQLVVGGASCEEVKNKGRLIMTQWRENEKILELWLTIE